MYLNEEENKEMVVELDDVEENVQNVELCIMGRILTNQGTSFNNLCSRMASVWRLKRGFPSRKLVVIGYFASSIMPLM